LWELERHVTRLEVVWFYVAGTLTAVVLVFGDMGLPEVLILVGLLDGSRVRGVVAALAWCSPPPTLLDPASLKRVRGTLGWGGVR